MDATKRESLNFSRVFTSSIQKVKEGASDFDNLSLEENKGTAAGEKGKSSENLESRQKQTSGEGTRPKSNRNSGKDSQFRTKGSSGEDSQSRTKHSSGEDSSFRTKGSSNGEDSQSRTKGSSGEDSSFRTKGSSSGEDSQSRTKGSSGEDSQFRTKRSSGEDSQFRTKGSSGEDSQFRTKRSSGEDSQSRTKGSSSSSEDSQFRTKRSSGEDSKFRTKRSSGEDLQFRTKGSSCGEDSQFRTTRSSSGEDSQSRTKGSSGSGSNFRRKCSSGGNSRSKQTSEGDQGEKSGQFTSLTVQQDTKLPLKSGNSPTEGKDNSANLDSNKSTPVVQHLDVPDEKLVTDKPLSESSPVVSLTDCSANKSADVNPPQKDSLRERKSLVKEKGNRGRTYKVSPSRESRGRGNSQRFSKRRDNALKFTQQSVAASWANSDQPIPDDSKSRKSGTELNPVSKFSSDVQVGESDVKDQGSRKYLSGHDSLCHTSSGRTDAVKNSIEREQSNISKESRVKEKPGNIGSDKDICRTQNSGNRYLSKTRANTNDTVIARRGRLFLVGRTSSFYRQRSFESKKTFEQNLNCQSGKPIDKKENCEDGKTLAKPSRSQAETKASLSRPKSVVKSTCRKPETKTVSSKRETKVVSGKPEIKAVSSTSKSESKAVSSKPETKAVSSKPETKAVSSKPETKAVSSKPENKAVSSKPETKAVSSKPETKAVSSKPETKAVSSKPETKAVSSKPETKAVSSKPETKAVSSKPETKAVSSKPASKAVSSKPETKTVCKKSADTFVYPNTTECWDSDNSNKSNSKQELGQDSITVSSECGRKSDVVKTDGAKLYGASKTESISDVKSESKCSASEYTQNNFVENTHNLEKVERELKSVESRTDTEVRQKFLSDIVGEKIRELRDQCPGENCSGSQGFGKARFKSGGRSKFYDKLTKDKKFVKQFERLKVSDKGVAAKTSVSVDNRQDQANDKSFFSGCESNAKKLSSVETVGSQEGRAAPDIPRSSSSVGRQCQGFAGSRSKFSPKGPKGVDKIPEENIHKEVNLSQNINDVDNGNIKIGIGDKETSLEEKRSVKKKKKRKNKKRRSSDQCSSGSGDIVPSWRESENSWRSANSGGKESHGHKNIISSNSSRGSNPRQWNRWGSEYSTSKNSGGKSEFVNPGGQTIGPKGEVDSVFEGRNKSVNSGEAENSDKNTCGRPNLNRGQKHFWPGKAEQNRRRNRGGSWESEKCVSKGAVSHGTDLDSRKSSYSGRIGKNIENNKKTDKVYTQRDDNRDSVDKNCAKKRVNTDSFGWSCEFKRNLPPRFRRLQEQQEFDNSTSKGHKQAEERFSLRNSSSAKEHRESWTQSLYSKNFNAGKVGFGRRRPTPEIKCLTDNLVEKLNLHGCVKTPSPSEDREKTRSHNSSVAKPAPWRTEVPFVLEGSEEAWSYDSIPLKQNLLLPSDDDLSAAVPLKQSSPLRPASVEALPSVEDKAGVLYRTASWVESLTDVRYDYDIVASFDEAPLNRPFAKDIAIADHSQESTYFECKKMSDESEIKMQDLVKKETAVDENANIVYMKSLNPGKSQDAVCVVDCKNSDESPRSRGPSPASCEDFFSAKSGSQVSGSTTSSYSSQTGRKDKRKVSPGENKQIKMARGLANRRSSHGSRHDGPGHQFDNRSRGSNFRSLPPGIMGRSPYIAGDYHQSRCFMSSHNEAQPYSFGSFPSPNRPQYWGYDSQRYPDINPTQLSPCQSMNSPGQYSPETLAKFRLPPPPPPGFEIRNKSRDFGKRSRTVSPRSVSPGFLNRSRSPVFTSPSSVAVGPSHPNISMAAIRGSRGSVETDNVCVVDVRHVPSPRRQGTLELVEAEDKADRKSRDTKQTCSGCENQMGKRNMGVFQMPDDELIEEVKYRQRAYKGRGRGTAVQSASAICFLNRPGFGAAATLPVLSKSCDNISMSSLPKTLISNDIKQEPDEATHTQDENTHCKGNETLQRSGTERPKVLECVSTAEKETEGKFVKGSKNLSRSPGSVCESYSSVSGSKSNESVWKITVRSQSDDNDESFGLAGENWDLSASMESESTEGQKFVVDDRGLCTESDAECSDAEAKKGKPEMKSIYHHPQPFIRWRKSEASPLTPGSPYDQNWRRARCADSPYSSYSPLPKGRGISPLSFDQHCRVRDKTKKQSVTTPSPVKVLRRGETIPEDFGKLVKIKEEQGQSHMSMNRKTLFTKSEPGVGEYSGDRVDGCPDKHNSLQLMDIKDKQTVLRRTENIKPNVQKFEKDESEKKTAKLGKKAEKENPVDWFEEGSPPRILNDSFSNKEALMQNARTRWAQATSVPVYDPWLSQYEGQQESGATAVGDRTIATSAYYPGLVNAGMGQMLHVDAWKKRMSAPLPNVSICDKFKQSEEQKEKTKYAKQFEWRKSTGSLPPAITREQKWKSWSSTIGAKTYLYMPEPKSAANKAGQMDFRTYSWGSLQDISGEALSGLTNSPAKSWRTKFREKLDNSDIPYVDSHCHIDFLYKKINYRGSWSKFQMMHADTFMHNYYACVTNFCDPNSFRESGMWRQILPEDGVYGSFGCHPKSATDYTDEKEDFLKHIIHHSKVVSLGEIGLDYSGGFEEHKVCQKEVFVRQLKIAVQHKKPLVIHCREAEEDCLSLMKEHVPKDHLIHRHCFTGHWYELEPWLAYFSNCYVGLTPLVTYRSAEIVHDVARRLPLERLLLETDAPYFRPPYVDKDDMNYSTPGMAICVAHEVAKLRGIAMDDVLLKARGNTLAVYGV